MDAVLSTLIFHDGFPFLNFFGVANFSGGSKYRRPILCAVVVWGLPLVQPGDFAAQGVAQVNGGVVQRDVLRRGPKFKLVSSAVALMAVVASNRQVD